MKKRIPCDRRNRTPPAWPKTRQATSTALLGIPKNPPSSEGRNR